jgi:hypothetical protein
MDLRARIDRQGDATAAAVAGIDLHQWHRDRRLLSPPEAAAGTLARRCGMLAEEMKKAPFPEPK